MIFSLTDGNLGLHCVFDTYKFIEHLREFCFTSVVTEWRGKYSVERGFFGVPYKFEYFSINHFK